jgi:pimeloyl-ACP methyl ester carboxylesterase
VGTSLGARVVQEFALAHPDLVAQAVMMAAHARPHPVQSWLSAGERALHGLPAQYDAADTGR